jgi:hypothetical protein
MSFSLGRKGQFQEAKLPKWAQDKQDAGPLFDKVESQVKDAVLSALEESVNRGKAPRDANFDLSIRTSKCLLAFDLYAYSALGVDLARATWNVARASLEGRDRKIVCSEF